jgi:hypothetical protein
MKSDTSEPLRWWKEFNAHECTPWWNGLNLLAGVAGIVLVWNDDPIDHHSMLWFAFFCWCVGVNLKELLRKLAGK